MLNLLLASRAWEVWGTTHPPSQGGTWTPSPCTAQDFWVESSRGNNFKVTLSQLSLFCPTPARWGGRWAKQQLLLFHKSIPVSQKHKPWKFCTRSGPTRLQHLSSLPPPGTTRLLIRARLPCAYVRVLQPSPHWETSSLHLPGEERGNMKHHRFLRKWFIVLYFLHYILKSFCRPKGLPFWSMLQSIHYHISFADVDEFLVY